MNENTPDVEVTEVITDDQQTVYPADLAVYKENEGDEGELCFFFTVFTPPEVLENFENDEERIKHGYALIAKVSDIQFVPTNKLFLVPKDQVENPNVIWEIARQTNFDKSE